MIALLLGGMLGIGLWLILMAQPLGRPRPDLAQRLQRLSVQGRLEMDAQRGVSRRLFHSSVLERLLRPLLEDAGTLVARVLARTGIGAPDLEHRLALAWPGMTPAQFYGQKLACALVFFSIFPLMNLLQIHPFGPWPVWLWVAAFVVGFALPDWSVEGRVAERRRRVSAELPTVLDLLAIAASAGMSAEQALLEVSRQTTGVLGEGLRSVVRETSLGAMTHAEALRALAEREGVLELLSLSDAWRAALEYGLPLGQSMLTLAQTVRDQERARLLEEGGKSAVRMLLPVALFIFPVFLVVLLYPAGVQLLALGQ